MRIKGKERDRERKKDMLQMQGTVKSLEGKTHLDCPEIHGTLDDLVVVREAKFVCIHRVHEWPRVILKPKRKSQPQLSLQLFQATKKFTKKAFNVST